MCTLTNFCSFVVFHYKTVDSNRGGFSLTIKPDKTKKCCAKKVQLHRLSMVFMSGKVSDEMKFYHSPTVSSFLALNPFTH